MADIPFPKDYKPKKRLGKKHHKKQKKTQKDKVTIPKLPNNKQLLNNFLELIKSEPENPSFKILTDKWIKENIFCFGQVHISELDKHRIKEPKNACEYKIAQAIWLAEASACIAMYLKRWVEENINTELRCWYSERIDSFTMRILPIKHECEGILENLPAELLVCQQPFEKKYQNLLLVAEKADKAKKYNLDTAIKIFRATTRSFHSIVMRIHSEALVMIEQLTKPANSGKAGDENKSAKEKQEGALEPKPPEILQKLLWLKQHGKKYWKLILLAMAILLILSIFAKLDLFNKIYTLIKNIHF